MVKRGVKLRIDDDAFNLPGCENKMKSNSISYGFANFHSKKIDLICKESPDFAIVGNF